ncbi:hypothetical protein VP01_1237g4 [Puccinia sorghi]|uniref:Uncharacterized protein n=1 Tax=Puccinia sorghi TaxID=27349 RepID=A0A0L6VPY2_9BASI|nr:hypothetical protein VP01_1237g4 [Puccinia sorghi]
MIPFDYYYCYCYYYFILVWFQILLFSLSPSLSHTQKSKTLFLAFGSLSHFCLLVFFLLLTWLSLPFDSHTYAGLYFFLLFFGMCKLSYISAHYPQHVNHHWTSSLLSLQVVMYYRYILVEKTLVLFLLVSYIQAGDGLAFNCMLFFFVFILAQTRSQSNRPAIPQAATLSSSSPQIKLVHQVIAYSLFEEFCSFYYTEITPQNRHFPLHSFYSMIFTQHMLNHHNCLRQNSNHVKYPYIVIESAHIICNNIHFQSSEKAVSSSETYKTSPFLGSFPTDTWISCKFPHTSCIFFFPAYFGLLKEMSTFIQLTWLSFFFSFLKKRLKKKEKWKNIEFYLLIRQTGNMWKFQLQLGSLGDPFGIPSTFNVLICVKIINHSQIIIFINSIHMLKFRNRTSKQKINYKKKKVIYKWIRRMLFTLLNIVCFEVPQEANSGSLVYCIIFISNYFIMLPSCTIIVHLFTSIHSMFLWHHGALLWLIIVFTEKLGLHQPPFSPGKFHPFPHLLPPP